jgi:SAM-dependent methyltransferase
VIDDARAALLARWDAGDAPPDERRVLVEALGKLGGPDVLARLRALAVGDDAELARRRDRAILMTDREALRDEVSTIAMDVPPPAPVTVLLRTRPGLEPLLLEELIKLGRAAHLIEGGVELTLTASWFELFEARLWATAAVRLPSVELEPVALARAIASPGVRALLAAWTRGPIRWRLGFASGHKRSIVWRVARDVAAAAPELVNDPTATTWEFLVADSGALELVPRRLDDPRFRYRVADVPAASHPTVAAALAWLGETRASDRVWDPFCGSGVELVERSKRGAYRALHGTDLDEAALTAARANVAEIGLRPQLANADARTHAAGPFDLIITNPPLGGRIRGDAGALLCDALPNFARQLAPGGRLVWITPAPRRTSPVAEGLGLQRVRSLAVDLGGMRGQVERWDRR